MKKCSIILLLILLPTLVMAQASGEQITRPVSKQQTGIKPTNGNSEQKVVREVTYESTLSAEEKRIWDEEKAKAREGMRILANKLKSQGLEPTTFGGFSEGLAWCMNKNREICCIDRKGNILFSLPAQISKVRLFKNGFAVVERGVLDANGSRVRGNVGVIDKKGNMIVPFGKYWIISDYSEGIFFAVSNNKCCGYINEKGNIVIPFIYEAEMGYGHDDIDDHSFHEGLACIKKDGKYGYVDKEGSVVIPPIYQSAHRFSEGIAAVEKDGKTGYIDKNGQIVIPFISGIWTAYNFNCGLAKIINRQIRFIDSKGTTVINTTLRSDEYNISDRFSEALIAICPNGYKSKKWGYMNKQGKVVIPGKYSTAADFSEGLAFVCRNGYSGFINKKGQVVIPFKFHNDFYVGMSFKDGIAPICHNDKWGYVDKYGNSTFDFE